MVRISYVFALALTLASAIPASAQQDSAAPALTPPLFAERQAVSDAAPIFSPAPSVTPARQKRPSVLVPMYVSFAALQGLDYSSTTRALRSGAGREANPLMRPIVGNRPAFIAVKAATGVVTIWAGEKLWKKNRAAAVVLMAVMNGAVGAVVAHNLSVAR
jgi:hypothetical protein